MGGCKGTHGDIYTRTIDDVMRCMGNVRALETCNVDKAEGGAAASVLERCDGIDCGCRTANVPMSFFFGVLA